MNNDFWAEISLAEFNARTNHAYPLAPSDDEAIEHRIEQKGVLLGVVVLNHIDKDYGYVVLGRDEHGRFRAIEVKCSHPSIDEARTALQSMMRKILAGGASIFPQDCLQ